MILARNSITLAHVTDISSVTWYYKLQASTATRPAKPTTDPPTGWTETEPAYTEGSTNSLYVCEKTVFTDGTFVYSEVSLSSSYEAAKLAYNKSVAAQQAAADALDQSVEYIVGTQSGATGSWTGVTRDTELKAGKTIAYKLPYAGSGNASLNLTLADGTTTGAKAVYSNTTRVTTHFGVNSVITMTYDGQYWRAAGAAPSNSNNYDRTQYKAALSAEDPIAAGRLAVMNTSGKLILLSAVPFDITCPILYVGTAYTAAALTQTNNYTMWGSPFNLANTKTGFSGVAGRPVYIKGTLSGNIFTPDPEVFTCTVPTSKDGKSYILLGTMSTTTNAVLNAEHPVYMYVGGAFKSTTQIAAEAQTNIDGLDQQEIFNRLTHNGEEQGFYLEDGKLYLNFEYAVGQTLKLGGVDNASGLLELYDAEGAQVGLWSNDGLYVIYETDNLKRTTRIRDAEIYMTYLDKRNSYSDNYYSWFDGRGVLMQLNDANDVMRVAGNVSAGVGFVDTRQPLDYSADNYIYGINMYSSTGLFFSAPDCEYVMASKDGYGHRFYGNVLADEYIAVHGDYTVGTTPSSNTLDKGVRLLDSALKSVGEFCGAHYTDGNVGVAIHAARSIGGMGMMNGLRLLLDASGNADVRIMGTGAVKSWRQALGIENSVSAVNPNAVNVPTGTDTTLCNTGALSAGTYLIECNAEFAAHTTGVRLIFLSTSSAGSTIDRTSRMAVQGGSNPGRPHFTHVITLSSTATLYLRAHQNSGTTLSVTGGMKILKLH